MSEAERATGTAVLEVRGVDVVFGGVHAITDVSTVVHPRELVAVIGPNGAGKSTLLNAISGLVRRQSRGEIRFNGESIEGMSVARRAVRGIGRSFQSPPLVDPLTVVQNVMAGAFGVRDYNVVDQLVRPWRVARSERAREEQARSILDFVGLSEIADLPASEIAYGQRKLVDIARALMSEPSLLLLDEPTSGLGRSEHDAMGHLLTRLMERGEMSVLMVEHHMDLVRSIATRVIGLQAGELVADGPTLEVLDSEEFRATLVGLAPPGGVSRAGGAA
jgi:ABC-type branched-subunit amino acid transport system ATPase component